MRFPFIIILASCIWVSSAIGQNAPSKEASEWINRHGLERSGSSFTSNHEVLKPLSESDSSGWYWTIVMACIAIWIWLLMQGRIKLIGVWLRGARASEWTRSEWQEWTMESGATLNVSSNLDVPHPDWLLLSPTERKVVELFANGFSVHAISEQLNCTKPHVYNIRSSIRKKWRMGPTEDLIGRIKGSACAP